jgi:hypothetical protein
MSAGRRQQQQELSSAPSEAAPAVDLRRLATLLGIAGSSHHDGEVINALRHADRLLRAAGMAWPDLLIPFRQLEIATEAARVLATENDALRAELRAHASAGDAALWSEVGGTADRASGLARWVLELRPRQRVWLSDSEVAFLRRAEGWSGPLTPAARTTLERLVEAAAARAGMQPPA